MNYFWFLSVPPQLFALRVCLFLLSCPFYCIYLLIKFSYLLLNFYLIYMNITYFIPDVKNFFVSSLSLFFLCQFGCIGLQILIIFFFKEQVFSFVASLLLVFYFVDLSFYFFPFLLYILGLICYFSNFLWQMVKALVLDLNYLPT